MKLLFILSMIVCNACYGQIDSVRYDVIEIKGKKYTVQINYQKGRVIDSVIMIGGIDVVIDTMPFYSKDTGQTTIGIITTKKGQDTVKVYATIQNKTTKKQTKAIIYSVRQQYKWSEHNTPDSEPQYFFKHIKYLGQDKKELPKKLIVIKSTELK